MGLIKPRRDRAFSCSEDLHGSSLRCRSSAALRSKRRIDRRGGEFIQIVGDGFQRNSKQKLHHLRFGITRSKELVDGSCLGLSTFTDNLTNQRDQSVLLAICEFFSISYCRDRLSGGMQEILGNRRVSCRAIVAVVFDACRKQNQLTFYG